MLVKAVDTTDKIIIIDNPRNFPSQGPFLIGCEAEQMLVTLVQGKSFIVNRAVNGTTAATHAVNLQVAPIIPPYDYSDFVQKVDQID